MQKPLLPWERNFNIVWQKWPPQQMAMIRRVKMHWNWNISPSKVVKATYCMFCRWIGISFAISWWMIGKYGGQFFSSITIPAAWPITRHTFISMHLFKRIEVNWIIKYKLEASQEIHMPLAIASSFRFSSCEGEKI